MHNAVMDYVIDCKLMQQLVPRLSAILWTTRLIYVDSSQTSVNDPAGREATPLMPLLQPGNSKVSTTTTVHHHPPPTRTTPDKNTVAVRLSSGTCYS